MRRQLLVAAAVCGLFLVISTGCSRQKAPPAPAPPPIDVMPTPVVHEHVPLGRLADAREGSTIALAKLGARTVAYVADEDDSSIRAVDLTTENEGSARSAGEVKELSVTPLVGRPAQVLVGKDGRLFVAIRDEQVVVVLAATKDETAPLDEVAQIATAVEPVALAMTPDDATLLVTSGWGHALEGFALASLARSFAVDLAREPRAVVASSDGKTAFVSHAGAGHVSVIDLADHSVKPIDVGMSGWDETRRGRGGMMIDFALDGDVAGDVAGEEPKPPVFRCGFGMMRHVVHFPARVARQGYALAKMRDEKSERIFAPHMEVATGDALVTSSGYGGGGSSETMNLPTEMFDIDVLDGAKRTRATGAASSVGVNLRIGADACRLPRAALVDEERHALYVSCLGVDKVIEYDASSKTPTGAMRRKIDVPAGPTGLALEPEAHRAVVWSAFDRVVSTIALGEKDSAPVAKIQLAAARAPLSEDVSAGRRLFHKAGEARIAKDGRACASCHPDGRDDGLVWSTPNGPRQTILLAGRVGRGAPFGWLGEHTTLKEHIKITMKNLKGTGVAESEYDSIVSYIGAMKAPPRAKAARLSAVEEHGSELFHGSVLGCSSCHADKTGFTDLDVHEVGSATVADTRRQFLAPSLRFVGGSAPYFHDGRYASLDELLRKNERMGDTKSLSEGDRAALEAYLRTL
jgi:mono/diheme cytochrome c family protein